MLCCPHWLFSERGMFIAAVADDAKRVVPAVWTQTQDDQYFLSCRQWWTANWPSSTNWNGLIFLLFACQHSEVYRPHWSFSTRGEIFCFRSNKLVECRFQENSSLGFGVQTSLASTMGTCNSGVSWILPRSIIWDWPVRFPHFFTIFQCRLFVIHEVLVCYLKWR